MGFYRLKITKKHENHHSWLRTIIVRVSINTRDSSLFCLYLLTWLTLYIFFLFCQTFFWQIVIIMLLSVCKKRFYIEWKQSVLSLNVYQMIGWHLSHGLKCHFFITIIKMIKRNKMIVMYLRIFIIKSLFSLLSNLLSIKIRGRHSVLIVSIIIIVKNKNVCRCKDIHLFYFWQFGQ